MGNFTGGAESTNSIGNLKVYLYSLYIGSILFFIGIMRLILGFEASGAVLMGSGSILLLVTSVIFFIRLFKLWRLVIDMSPALGLTPSIRTPGRAVGFLFIPFYNLYWVFITLGKLPRDLNAMAHASDTPTRVPAGLGIAVAVLSVISVIPFVGQLAGMVNGLILLPVFLTGVVRLGGEVAANISAAGKTGDTIQVQKHRPDIRSLPDLMDPEKFGIRAGIILAFPAAKLLASTLLESLVSLPLYAWILKFALVDIFIGVLTGVLFVVTGSLIRKAWLLPIVWGLVWIPMDFVTRYLLEYSATGRQPPKEFIIKVMLGPTTMIYSFLGGVIFMAALVLVVRFWGVRPWSLPAGLLGFHVLSNLPQWIMYPPGFFEYGIRQLFFLHIVPALGIAVLGLMLYFALRPPLVISGQPDPRKLDV